MVRIDGENWIKTSTEFKPEGASHLGAVVTQLGASDWSMTPLSHFADRQFHRIERRGPDYTVFIRLDDGPWSRVRLARLLADTGRPVLVAPYACSPTGAGCDVVVHRWAVAAI